MKATHFHADPSWQRRTIDLTSVSGAAGWKAAQAFAADGATVYLADVTGRERALQFEQRIEARGLGDLLLQRGSATRGDIRLTVEGHESFEGHEASEVPPTSTGWEADAVGRVTLVGGGPGDPDLLTVGALKAIAHADAIFLDRLGIALNVFDMAPGALVLDVGKAPGRHKLPQERINEEMRALAVEGASVVRLKGGDVFIFGRGGEEWKYLSDHGIPVTVIPGVTSALSVPSHAGISATLRNVTRAVTIISGHQPFNGSELRSLLYLGGTVVILMGVATFPSTVAGLLKAGMPPSTGVALLENGFSAEERHTFTTLGEALEDARAVGVKNPAIIVIGEVVNLRVPTIPRVEQR